MYTILFTITYIAKFTAYKFLYLPIFYFKVEEPSVLDNDSDSSNLDTGATENLII